MAGLKTIKTKIRSVGKSRQVTKAMEAVSAVKMRKAQARALGGRAYARAATAILARLSGSQELAMHPLTTVRHSKKSLYIVITSDKGLAGALNSAVLRAVYADMQGSNASVIAVGRKANDFFAARGFVIEAFHPSTDEIDSKNIRAIVDEAAKRFAEGAVDIVKVCYQNFISTFEQRPTLRTLFPLSLRELEAVVHGIVPARGMFAEATSEVHPSTYTFEPDEAEVLNAILPRLAGIFMYHALLESQASEHSARMVAMKSASDKAEEMGGELTLQFNKARQAAITREVSEIISGMETLV